MQERKGDGCTCIYIVEKCFFWRQQLLLESTRTVFRVTVTFLKLIDGNDFTSKCEQKRKKAIQEEGKGEKDPL